MRILVTGSRSWTNYRTLSREIVHYIGEHYPITVDHYGLPVDWNTRDVVIIHGACPHGADALADAPDQASTAPTEPPTAPTWPKHTESRCDGLSPQHSNQSTDSEWGHWCYEQEPVTLPASVPRCPQCGALDWRRVTPRDPDESE
jgi:hypothetical protein